MRAGRLGFCAWRIVACAAVCGGLCGCAAGSSPQASSQQPMEPTLVVDAYRQGVAEAIQELRQNAPTIYTVVPPTAEFDAETNLPLKSAGGPANPFLMYRLLGHNDSSAGTWARRLARRCRINNSISPQGARRTQRKPGNVGRRGDCDPER